MMAWMNLANLTQAVSEIKSYCAAAFAAITHSHSAATTSAAGFMSSSDKKKLDGIATGAQVNSITGVKGNSESSYRTGNINLTPANIGALALSGGTLTGALNLANNTWNTMGDDAYIGDCNAAGCIGIKGKNGATGISFQPYSGNTAQTISTNGSGTMNISGSLTVAGAKVYDTAHKPVASDIGVSSININEEKTIKTSYTYTGLSVSVPAKILVVLSVDQIYNNVAPTGIAISSSSTSMGWNYLLAKDETSELVRCTAVVYNPDAAVTLYIWARASAQGSNRIVARGFKINLV